MEKLQKFKAERAVLRREITKYYNQILSDQQPLTAVEISKVTKKYNKLQEVDSVLSELLPDDTDWEAETELKYSYDDKFEDILANCLPESKPDTKPVPSSSIQHLHLPQLQFVKFDGQLKNWTKFWAQFQRIHESNLEEEIKFQYLLQYVEGKAKLF